MNPIMKFICQFCLLVVLMLSSLSLVAQEAIDPGQAYFNQGNFEKAVEYWAEALPNISPEKNPKRYIDMSVRLAAAYQKLGRLKEAIRVLKSAQYHAYEIKDQVRKANVLMQLSDVYVAMRDFQENRMDCGMKKISEQIIPFKREQLMKEAWDFLENAEILVCKNGKYKKSESEYCQSSSCKESVCFSCEEFVCEEPNGHSLLLANILNRQGNVLSVQAGILSDQNNKPDARKKYASEISPKYQDSLKFSDQADDDVLSTKVLLNNIQGAVQVGLANKWKNEQKIKTILQRIKNLPDSHDKAFALLNIAQFIQTLYSLSTEEMHNLIFSLDKGKKVDCHSITKFKIFDNKTHNKWFAYCTLMDALKVAENQGDKLAIIYAKFYLAQFHGETKDYGKALQLIRQALFYARNYPQFHIELQRELWGYPELLFRLEWYLGKFLKAQEPEKHQKAICDAYKRADKYLQLVRRGYGSLSQAFLNDAKQFYFDWADFLLQQTSKISDDSEKQKQLKEAIKVVEWFEAAEVRDYFLDDCIARRLEEKIQHLDDSLQSNVAIFYPLLFEDRIELLLISKDKKIKQETILHTDIQMDVDKIKTTIKNFEYACSFDNNCCGDGKKIIYKWFEPIFQELDERIDTLIVVPHGKLYTVPFAALYDGKKFLIEKYALMVTPGIKLTDSISLKQQRDNALLGGLSLIESEEGTIKLCSIPGEIRKISCLLTGKQEILNNSLSNSLLTNCLEKGKEHCNRGKSEANTVVLQCLKESGIECGSSGNEWMSNDKDRNIIVLQDEEFTLSNVKTMLRKKIPYSIVHFATHGEFSSNPDQTFLKTFDSRITMKSLNELILINQSFRHQPVELLTLSACNTAKGDERAALGLASVAISAGVPSALATLWIANDSSTALLMVDFYDNLLGSSKIKAKALQEAQKNFLRSSKECEGKYADPHLWAPFLLIGNGL
jgi:CHAT domain-containing protein